MSSENSQPSKPRPDVFTPIYRVLVLLLLSGIALILFFGLFHKSSLTPECQSAIEKANVLITTQSSSITGLSNSYKNDVYNNPNVDNIYQQILMANEYQFNTLEILTLQTAALLDITTTCH